MRLRRSPKIGPRYWTAIAIASMCGTNAGDCLPDVFGIGTAPGLAILTALFAVVVGLERLTRRGSEAFYWIAILVVRAAATNVADCAIGYWRLSYAAASALLSILMVILIRLSLPDRPARGDSDLPSTGGAYWATMLAAGSLGTIVGDGIGHAFGVVEIGVPVSAALATVALAVSLSTRLTWRTVGSYWLTVVVVRWWGTNLGDILAHFLSLGGSLLATASTLILVLSFWPARPPVAADRNHSTYIF